MIYRVDKLRGAVKGGLQPFFLEDGEHDALRHLAAVDEKGGVLTTFYSGQAVPAYTGRATWLGATSWTPHFKARRDAATRLFSGELDRAAAARLIERSGARFLYSDCQGHPDIGAIWPGWPGRRALRVRHRLPGPPGHLESRRVDEPPLLSVVVPVLNEEEGLPELHAAARRRRSAGSTARTRSSTSTTARPTARPR